AAGILEFGRGDDTSPADITADVPANAWLYIAATWDGTVASLYVNGGLAGTSSHSPAGNPTGGLWVGKQAELSDYGVYPGYYEGRMADVAVYTAALDAGTINQHAQGSPGGTGGDGTGTVTPGGPGSVLTVGDDGSLSWQPPTTVVEHGGGTPD